MSWQPGNHITIAMVDFGMLFQVLPVTVVHDQPDELMVWLPEATPDPT